MPRSTKKKLAAKTRSVRRPRRVSRKLSSTSDRDASAQASHADHVGSGALTLRSLFWQNFVRELLTSLSATLTAHSDKEKVQLDGRIALLTHAGERIPVAEVHPLFACSIQGSDADRDLSAAVQCSIFRIVTPLGEAFTLPVSEIRAVHAVSEELQNQIESEMSGGDGKNEPFGFAAYAATSAQQAAQQGAQATVGPI